MEGINDDADVREADDGPDVLGHLHGLFGKQLVLEGRSRRSSRSERDEQGSRGEYLDASRERPTILPKSEHNGSYRRGRLWTARCNFRNARHYYILNVVTMLYAHNVQRSSDGWPSLDHPDHTLCRVRAGSV